MSMRLLRLSQRLNQSNVANAIGIAQDTYSRWERNPKMIPLGKAVELANVLGANTVDELLEEEEV